MEFRAGAAVMMTWQISGSLHETLYMTEQKKKEKGERTMSKELMNTTEMKEVI